MANLIGGLILLVIFAGIVYWGSKLEVDKTPPELKDFPECIVCGRKVTEDSAGATVPMKVGGMPLVAIYCEDHGS